MSNIKSNYTGDGVTVLYTITFSYLKRAHVKATINGSGTTAFTFANDTTIQFNTAPANGAAIVLFRDTPADQVDNTFFPNSSIRSKSLNDNFTQTLFVSEEAREIAADAQTGNLVPGSIGTVVLADGAVTNAKVSNTAAIAGTKISPDFGSQNVVTTGDVQSASINGGPLAGFRNAIINGNFDIWQRGTSTTIGYGADRWFNAITGSTCTFSRQSFTLGQTDVPDEPTYFARELVSSVAGAGNFAYFYQNIESVRTFAGKEVTISFWAKADASKPIAVNMLQFFGTGGSPSASVPSVSPTKFTLTTSWQKITHTVTIPSISGKTLGSNNNDFLRLEIWLDAGSNRNDRSDSLGQQSGTFDIAQVQIEAGPVATPFERRPIGTELALCQRYYQQSYRLSVTPGTVTGQGAVGMVAHATTLFLGFGRITLAQPMRITPTFTAYNPITGATSNQVRNTGTATNHPLATINTNEYGFSAYVNNSSIGQGQEAQFHYTASAEI